MNLLLLNDEILTAQTMEKDMDWTGCGIDEVYLAYNVDEAKRIMLEHEIDIALCDIEMPGENGIDFLRWIRRENMDSEVIFLTCHASFAYAQEAVKLGCQDYILIPARYEDIAQAIYRVVLRRKNEKDHQLLENYGKQWIGMKRQEAAQASGVKRTPQEIVEDSVSYIMENLGSEQLTVSEVANHSYLNSTYLNRIFKKEKGISISQFIIQEKMELAAMLLKDGKLSAQVVAVKVGYLSYPHFSSTFKKYYGVSPANYVK